jgi:hypothetical protein
MAWETCSSSVALEYFADRLSDAASEVLGRVGGADDGADRLVEIERARALRPRVVVIVGVVDAVVVSEHR